VAELRIGDQWIRFEREATAAAYSVISQGDADRCTCQGCRNFACQRDNIYPGQFLNLLSTLGIDPSKEGEAVHYGQTGQLYFYGGWFYFVGEVLEKGESVVTIGCAPKLIGGNHQLSPVPEGFQYFIGTSFPKPPKAFGSPVIAVEFSTVLPWRLDEPYDPEADRQIRTTKDIIRRYSGAMRKLANTED